MAYVENLTDAEFVLFSDEVALDLEGDYPVYATFISMPGRGRHGRNGGHHHGGG